MEMIQYLSSDFSGTVTSDPLLYWWDNREQFPLLAQVGMAHLSIPTGSVGPERRFSGIGRVVNGRWNLKPSTVGLLLTLKDWYADFPEIFDK